MPDPTAAPPLHVETAEEAATLTLNQRLARRGYRVEGPLCTCRKSIIDAATGAVVAVVDAFEGSAWVDAGCPLDVEAFLRGYYEAQS